jgi:hypothetical protein
MRRGKLAGAALLACAAACEADDSNIVRGRRLAVATLAPAEQAHVYEAAARGSFSVDDPSLSLLLDPRLLPRTVGLAPDGRVSDSVTAELRARKVIRGTCEPPLAGTTGTAHCTAELPGYVLRFSRVFALKPDSVQVYVYAQKYDTPSSGVSETLRFERAYQVVKHGEVWEAVREGHVPKEIRNEPK